MIISDYNKLPKRYNDQDGLPFRKVPLTKKEVLQIFGTAVDISSANRLLRRLHGRRVAGTLEDPSIPSPSLEQEKLAEAEALEWLREHVPVDEIANAGLRAEQELSEMDAEILRDAEKMAQWTPNAQDVAEKPGGVYGKGVFQRMREEAEAKAKEQEAIKKRQAEEHGEKTGTLMTSDTERRSTALQRGEMSERMLYWQEKGKVTTDQVAPNMSAFARLWPSGLLLVVTCGLGYLFAVAYNPPKHGDRMWPTLPTSAATILGLIAINTALFVVWRIPPCWNFMNRYFLQVPAYPYAVSLLGAMFSHQQFKHLVMNMVVLYIVGTRLHEEIGRGPFLGLYIASGAMGSMASLTYRVLTNSFITSSLGASAGVAGLIGFYLLLHSQDKVTILGVFPPEDWPSISSVMLLGLLVGLDIIGLLRQKRKSTTVDHYAHLGGYATGIGCALVARDQLRKRKEREVERRRNMGFMEKIKERRF